MLLVMINSANVFEEDNNYRMERDRLNTDTSQQTGLCGGTLGWEGRSQDHVGYRLLGLLVLGLLANFICGILLTMLHYTNLQSFL